MGYGTVALDFTLTGKLPAVLSNQIPTTLAFPISPSLKVLRRCTLDLSDSSHNHRLSALTSTYDILALRPTTEKTLQQACQSLECDLISLDLSTRFPFYFKHTTLANALQRGIRFEICYSPGVLNSDGGLSRRNMISNATQLIRVTRGRGLVISSEAKRALACRGPADVVNLAVLWGLGQERGVEAISREARNLLVQAEMKRTSFRGVLGVVYGGEKPTAPLVEEIELQQKGGQESGKRKAGTLGGETCEDAVVCRPISKREQKRQAKKARLESAQRQDAENNDPDSRRTAEFIAKAPA